MGIKLLNIVSARKGRDVLFSILWYFIVDGVTFAALALLLRKQLGCKLSNRWRFWSGLILIVAASAILDLFDVPFFADLGIMAFLVLAYACFCFSSERETRLFWGLLAFVLRLASRIAADSVSRIGGFALPFYDLSFTGAFSAALTALIALPFYMLEKNQMAFPKKLRVAMDASIFACAILCACLAGLSKDIDGARLWYPLVASAALLAFVYCMTFIFLKISALTLSYLEEQFSIKQHELSGEISSFRHDFVNHMTTVGLALEAGNSKRAYDYIKNININLQRIDSFAKTGNDTLDSIIENKASIAQSHGIDVNIIADWPAGAALTDMDIVTIFGNLLDNAIEACEKLHKDAAPYISIRVAAINEMLQICVKNSSPGIYRKNAAGFTTTKNEPGHGIGLKNIEKICAQFDGSMDIISQSDEFSVTIYIPISDKDKSRGLITA